MYEAVLFILFLVWVIHEARQAKRLEEAKQVEFREAPRVQHEPAPEPDEEPPQGELTEAKAWETAYRIVSPPNQDLRQWRNWMKRKGYNGFEALGAVSEPVT